MVKLNREKLKLNLFLDWIISMLCYGALILIMSKIFTNTIQIDYSLYGLWSFLLAIIIYVLNKLVKPILVYITLPITSITMGLFYPFINVIILKFADLILGNHFDTHGILMTCLVAILLGFLNMILDKFLITPLLRKDG